MLRYWITRWLIAVVVAGSVVVYGLTQPTVLQHDDVLAMFFFVAGYIVLPALGIIALAAFFGLLLRVVWTSFTGRPLWRERV